MKIQYVPIMIIILILLIIIKNTNKEHFEDTEYEEVCNAIPTNSVDQSCWCQSPEQYLNTKYPDRDVNPVSETDKKWNCQRQGQKTFLLFYTDWCSFSKQMMPIWDSISNRENTNAINKFIKINCDKLSENHKGPDIAKYYNVKQLPTILLITGENKDTDVFKYTGDIDETQLARFVSQH